jgi:phage repressor protein C with HTH and peptisase S24 domain
MNLHSRLKNERERLGLSQTAFGALGGAGKTTVISWERGTASPNAAFLEAVAASGADVQYILTGRHENTVVQKTELSELVMVPRYDVQASAGGGALIHSELIVDHLAFRPEWVSKMGLNRQKLALVEVHGDSMEPALYNTDLILIDLRAAALSVNGIYVIQHRGHLLVKRIQTKLDGTVVIKSDNPAYESEFLARDEAESLIVLGRVVWYGRGM